MAGFFRTKPYVVPDDRLPAGSTLGAPKVTMVLKATGAIEQVYATDAGVAPFGPLVIHHWDARTGVRLVPEGGTFHLYPERQEHRYVLVDGVGVRETLFVDNGGSADGEPAVPPAAYVVTELHNEGTAPAEIATYAFCQLRGGTAHDVVVDYDARRRAFVVRNAGDPSLVRLFASATEPDSFEATSDHAKCTDARSPGRLANATAGASDNPVGIFAARHVLAAGERATLAYTLTFSVAGRAGAERTFDALPAAADALRRTTAFYERLLERSVILTPDADVNSGVFWAKANMLRVESHAPTGWCFVNDPTRSNNTVGRDTAWFGFGADYFTPAFVRDALLGYVERQEPSGMMVEYYDVRTGAAEDYGLNVNDDTPLLVLALWHHAATTGNRAFLERVYPAAVRAGRYLLSQRRDDGLVWCTAQGTADWGIAGWRNVIPGYRLSGATTELNAECYAALTTIARMAADLGNEAERAEFAGHAAALREAINARLKNPDNGLYLLNVDVDGGRRTDVTADLVFPVMFGVADDETAAAIVSRLSRRDFWTEAGIRTVPRDALDYEPAWGAGLLGGVWVGVTFWFAFAAARFDPAFMARALATSFRHYASDPLKHNTVPGQFSEWLHGETLTNQGMMLSPWFAPRYLWAAIEGIAGFDPGPDVPAVHDRLPPDWEWLAARNVPYRDRELTWFIVRAPEPRVYATFDLEGVSPETIYEEDATAALRVDGDDAAGVALRDGDDAVLLLANTAQHTVSTAVRFTAGRTACYRMRIFNSMLGRWSNDGTISPEELARGRPVELERAGFVLIELSPQG